MTASRLGIDGSRVLFRCDAGRADGLGHVMRSLVLADAFAQHGAIPIFVTAMGADFVGASRIMSRGYTVITSPARVGADADRDAISDLWGCGGADLVIVDSKRADASYLAACRAKALLLLIDDDADGAKPVDILVNNQIDADASHYCDSVTGRSHLLGPSYNLVDPGYFPLQRPAEGQIQRVLITFGGEDPGNHTRWAMETLVAAHPELIVDVALGPAHPDPESVRAAAKRLANAKLVEEPASLRPLAARADLAVTAGGTTLFELAAARVPALVVTIEDHQRRLVKPFAAAGACVLLGDHRMLDDNSAQTIFTRAIDDAELRARMQRAQAVLLPAPGAERIVDAIGAIIKKRRSAA